MSKVTVLGIGAMGSRMAKVLLKSGYEVTVWNRDRAKTTSLVEAGAQLAMSPRDAVKFADFVISVVRDDEASKHVWLDKESGALANLPTGAIAIESSTVTVAWARELAEHCRKRDTAFLDAPVAGTRPQAEAAQLIYLVGGEAEVVEKAKPILMSMGSAIHHAGPAGSGAAIKLMVNTLFGVQVAVIAELIGLIKRCGLDKNKAVEIVSSTPVCSTAAKVAANAIIANKFAPMFPIDLVEKDFSYVIETAKENSSYVPIAESTRHIFAKAIKEGFGDDNITGIVQLYQ